MRDQLPKTKGTLKKILVITMLIVVGIVAGLGILAAWLEANFGGMGL